MDNDNTRFYWADTENGRGVIYRLIDEYNNDLPYDFKNILFLRYMDNNNKGIYTTQGVTREEIWCYTFSIYSTGDYAVDILTEGDIWDLSIFGNMLVSTDVGCEEGVIENKIDPCIAYYVIGVDTSLDVDPGVDIVKPRYALGNNVILMVDYDFSDNGGMGVCSYNKIGNNFTYNTFSRIFSVSSNIIGNLCRNNVFSDFNDNIIGNSFNNNNFRETSVYSALFGSRITNLTIYSNVKYAQYFIIESYIQQVTIQTSSSATSNTISNFTITSGFGARGNSQIINHDPSNNNKHTTYVPTGSSQIEV